MNTGGQFSGWHLFSKPERTAVAGRTRAYPLGSIRTFQVPQAPFLPDSDNDYPGTSSSYVNALLILLPWRRPCGCSPLLPDSFTSCGLESQCLRMAYPPRTRIFLPLPPRPNNPVTTGFPDHGRDRRWTNASLDHGFCRVGKRFLGEAWGTHSKPPSQDSTVLQKCRVTHAGHLSSCRSLI